MTTQTFFPRAWQQRCHDRFEEVYQTGTQKHFAAEASMGSGKSAMMAWLGQTLLQQHGFDHILVIAPWKSVQDGLLETFGRQFQLQSRSQFFSTSRRMARHERPFVPVTVTTYQEVSNQAAVDSLVMWKTASPWRCAVFYDEIHHANELDSQWGAYVKGFTDVADFVVYMSGTFFRSDKKPIQGIPLDSQGKPIKDFKFTYKDAVRENVVRAVTTRDFDPEVNFQDIATGELYSKRLSTVSGSQELAEAKREVLNPAGRCISQMIADAHIALQQTRKKFEDAAYLYICRPGRTEGEEDRHVNVIADRIRQHTGDRAAVTIVTHHDKDAVGKINQFREDRTPYLVAINMVSEGCNIPRLRGEVFCRYTDSEMLFRQIVGRMVRHHRGEDGTAALLFLPLFPNHKEFAMRLQEEADEGIRERRCPVCGQYPCACICSVCNQMPCICPCPICGEYPCVCPPPPPREQTIFATDVDPRWDGGHVGNEHVAESWVRKAQYMKRTYPIIEHSNETQLGYVLQMSSQMPQDDWNPPRDVQQEREALRVEMRDYLIPEIGRHRYRDPLTGSIDFKTTYFEEIERPFGTKFRVIVEDWLLERVRPVRDRLRRRLIEVRHA